VREAAGGAGADHGASALRAAQAAGEQVVRRVRGAVGVGFAACFQDSLGVVEGGGVDDGGVGAGDCGAVEGQLAEVDPVVQDAQDVCPDQRRPVLARCPRGVQFGRDARLPRRRRM
jgi:hypothetical protein